MIPFEDPKYTTADPNIFYTDFFSGHKKEYQDSFLSIVKPYLDEFHEICSYKFTAINEFWCQKYKAGDTHIPHTHGALGYACVFYAKLSEEHEGTFFYSPFINESGVNESGGVLVKEGDLLIFPSNLLHMARPHASNEDRIIIAFNLI
jgi:hypothetical protein